MGPQTPLADQAAAVGIEDVQSSGNLTDYIQQALGKKRFLHYLPPYHDVHISKLSNYTGWPRDKVQRGASQPFREAVISQRSVKGTEEIEELEKALDIAYDMHTTTMRMAKAGISEREIAGRIEGIALSAGAGVPFPVILSIHGEILHNHRHDNILSPGDMLINDSGAESNLHYASDITRTVPVGGRFTGKQNDIYQIVLAAQTTAIEAIRPGEKNIDVHLQCAKILTEGLKHLGLMKGNVEEAVASGAHALFFPHGLGHMLGLDVHDMEGLGENLVGYNEEVKRSDQFGLAYLRLAKTLQPGYVLTVEPGIYFIPALIEKWKKEKKCDAFINYERIEDYKGFGGIRIEDNIVVTEKGARIPGKAIPKTIPDLEAVCGE
jgi:Xaa-Pro dipeptidase